MRPNRPPIPRFWGFGVVTGAEIVSSGCTSGATGIEGATGADEGSEPCAVTKGSSVCAEGSGRSNSDVRDATLACCIEGSDGSGTEASGDGEGAEAGSGIFICGRDGTRDEIWAMRESTVSSCVGAALATVAPGSLGVGMVKICVE